MKKIVLIIALLCAGAFAQEFNLEPSPSRISCVGATCKLNGNVLSINVPIQANTGTYYIDPTNVLWGAKGDCSTDDTAVFTTISNSLRNTGGHVIVPKPTGGCYKISNGIQWAPGPGSSINGIVVECAGRFWNTIFKWYGADQQPMFLIGDATNRGAASIINCGFTGNSATQRPIAIQISSVTNGVIGPEIRGNYMRQYIWEGIRVNDSWIGWIQNNYFYAAEHANIHFGPAGIGPVNQYVVTGNEIACGGHYNILSDATGNGGSNGNHFTGNDIECTLSTTLADIDVNDSDSYFQNRLEIGQGPNDPSYVAQIYRGSRNEIYTGGQSCLMVAGGGNKIYGHGEAGATCQAPNAGYGIIDSSNNGRNQYISHGDRRICTGTGCASGRWDDTPYVHIDTEHFKVYKYAIGIQGQDTGYGKTFFAGTTFYRSSSDGANPSTPNQLFSNTPIDNRGLVFNDAAGLSGAENNLFWFAPSGMSQPFVGANLFRGGWLSKKWHGECAGAAPSSGQYRQGDFCENTTPTELGTAGSKYVIFRYQCVADGNPGTWIGLRALTGN